MVTGKEFRQCSRRPGGRHVRATGFRPALTLDRHLTHMLLGWDHLLFAAGVVLLAGQPRRAASMIR
jgi:hypothetical protein